MLGCRIVPRIKKTVLIEPYYIFLGKSMRITRNEQSFQVDWQEVFDIGEENQVTFSLFVGSTAMYTDILEKHYVEYTHYTVGIPGYTVLTERVHEIYFTVKCIYPNGLFSTYSTSYKI